MKIFRNEAIEDLAQRRLDQLQRELGRPLAPPIPIDLLAEKVLGLDFLWEPIEELPGEIVFGGLIPEERLVVLNENRKALFEEKPGLERFTKGHEMGHWDLFVDKARLHHPNLFETAAQGPFIRRSCPSGEVVILGALQGDPDGEALLRQIAARADQPDEARAVNRYAAAICTPRDLIRAEALAIDRTQWGNLYQLAQRWQVTITALRVRLEQLDLLFVDKQGRLYESKDQARGQRSLFP
jgi:Zn-dependent peptidase ImmA (M78 family)